MKNISRILMMFLLMLPLTSTLLRAESSVSISQQDGKRITVVVSDAMGAMPGANVLVKGTTIGNITDMNGAAVLENIPKGATIVISSVGYVTQEVVVGNSSDIKVLLQEDVEALEEVVVVGYSTQKKVNLTGSVATVNFEELESRPVTDASQALAGASPGLQILQGSGEPNAESFSFNIRGVGTLNEAGPLVLVDGMEQSLSMVNPSDIASVSVLKDAASCAIYGNRGANGVILVTTKNGTAGKVNVTYDGTFSYNQPFKIIHTVSDYPTYMRMMNESANN